MGSTWTVAHSRSYIEQQLSFRFNSHFPGGLADFIGAKHDGGGGNNWSYTVQDVQSFSQIVTIKKPTPSFLQAGCPS